MHNNENLFYIDAIMNLNANEIFLFCRYYSNIERFCIVYVNNQYNTREIKLADISKNIYDNERYKFENAQKLKLYLFNEIFSSYKKFSYMECIRDCDINTYKHTIITNENNEMILKLF